MPRPATPLTQRLPVLAAILTILILLTIGVHTQGSVAAAWRWIGVPSLSPLFADIRVITHSIDAVRAGYDPYLFPRFDPWHRPYNYPPIWLCARYLGITSSSSNVIGVLFALLTGSALLLLLRARTWLSALLIFAAIPSCAVLIAVERGNTDLVIFSLLVFGLLFIGHQPAARRDPLTGLLITFLTILKLYPIVTSVMLLRQRNGIFKTFVTVAIAAAAILITCGHRLRSIANNTPRDTDMAFGASPFFLKLSASSHSLTLLFTGHPRAASVAALLLGCLALLAAILCRESFHRLVPRLSSGTPRDSLAIAGLVIYCFVFISEASFDYRLIYLLLPLSALIDDLNRRVSLRSLPPALAILLLLWAPVHFSLFHELMDGLVFLFSFAWLGITLLPVLYLKQPEQVPA